MLTIQSHTQSPDGGAYTLCVRVPSTAPEAFASIAGTASWAPTGEDETPTDTLVTMEWPADVDPDAQKRETRLLIEHALDAATEPEAEPVAVTEPGTEL